MSKSGKRRLEQQPSTRHFRVIFLTGAAVILAIYAAALWRGAHRPAPTIAFDGLLNTQGRVLDAGAFDHRYKLVFFGFTGCAAVCPMTLVKLRSVLNTIEPQNRPLTPLFVTLDPEHDQPNVLKSYIEAIDARVIGVTGDRQRIDQLAETLGAIFVRHPETTGPLALDHSARLYLLDPDNRLLTSYEAEEAATAIAADLLRQIRG
jgi:protein SCO1/2